MDARIRAALPGDLPELTRIYNHYVTSTCITFDTEPFTVEGRRGWFEAFSETGPHRLLVAEVAGRVGGYATSKEFRPKPAYATTVETTVYLDPELVGAGIGKLLYGTLLELMVAEEGVHRVVAGIALPNPKSIALHERLGFELIGTFHEVGFKFGRYWDVSWYEKDVSGLHAALDLEELLDRRRAEFMAGGSALPLVELLLEAGRNDEAGAIGRLALGCSGTADRSALEAIVERLGRPPDGWTEALVEFARAPTVEGWEELMRFTPDDVFYARSRHAIGYLLRLGADPDALFRCATRWGVLPDALDIAERGLVDPGTVVARADEGPPTARGLWLGLAAQAAFARGDRLGTVRLLRDAYQQCVSPFTPERSARSIRAEADADLHEALDRAGIPRF